MSGSTPTNGDYLNAINATKIGDPAAIPTGYSLLYSSSQDSTFAQNGLAANAYQNQSTGQIVIAYLGPVTPSNFYAPDDLITQAATKINQRIANNDPTVTAEMQVQANRFFNAVKSAAATSSAPFLNDNSNVFVTGNSEGAVFAQLTSRE
jgi:hypothetical protein